MVADIPHEKAPAAVQSVDRALMVLEIIGKFGSAGVTEIATELGVHKSTVSRLITVLESRGFVEQLSDRGKYRLGFTIVRLAGSTSAQMDLAKESQPVCDELAQQSGETTNIAILDGDRIINIVEAHGPAEITLRTWVGQNCPAHATSSGKALLSALPPAAVRELLGEKLPTFTDNTIADVKTLAVELDQARTAGWASVTEELEVGLNAVAAPVRDSTGKVIAALSVSGPAYRLAPDRFRDVAVLTTQAAERISRRLGYVG
ncbi:IclR family transcriptional regulator [Mycobacterium sp. MS1601]|uniref:IclR family transcriptional regulator n=1 Tax=Mycobacterium sp. MS1601 TaxID=1936029 RepID=UPI000979147F|nr:IclR family transcriptional regulator [Mycobacterium sp. MS1601]AQA06381.1 IclR family transcriptional regulator [Mycobacterium sp. MS1601]